MTRRSWIAFFDWCKKKSSVTCLRPATTAFCTGFMCGGNYWPISLLLNRLDSYCINWLQLPTAVDGAVKLFEKLDAPSRFCVRKSIRRHCSSYLCFSEAKAPSTKTEPALLANFEAELFLLDAASSAGELSSQILLLEVFSLLPAMARLISRLDWL